jgi:hypothetical protein
MKPIIRILAAASLGVVALGASAARADESRWDHRPVPIASPAYASRTEHGSWNDRADGRRDDRDERDRRRREIEAARERFYASWDGSQRRQARFEAWYAARCAELNG